MKELEIKVKGMMCNGCENRVQNALKTIEGVKEVVANHATGIVKVTANEEVSENAIKEKIEDIGYEIER
jgi:copper chaperone